MRCSVKFKTLLKIESEMFRKIKQTVMLWIAVYRCVKSLPETMKSLNCVLAAHTAGINALVTSVNMMNEQEQPEKDVFALEAPKNKRANEAPN